jgi:hypothetical protein
MSDFKFRAGTIVQVNGHETIKDGTVGEVVGYGGPCHDLVETGKLVGSFLVDLYTGFPTAEYPYTVMNVREYFLTEVDEDPSIFSLEEKELNKGDYELTAGYKGLDVH